jgi:hypothetical protein
VTRARLHHRPLARDVFVTLAALALALRVLIPAGFMVAPMGTSSGLSPIVLCSGQGPITKLITADGRVVDRPTHDPHDDGKSHHGAPCAFAGITAGPLPSAVQTPVAYAAGHQDAHQPLPPGLRPGLGLCAPPPPATGPPSRL